MLITLDADVKETFTESVAASSTEEPGASVNAKGVLE